MTEPIDLTERKQDRNEPVIPDRTAASSPSIGVPSNPVYARVGDSILNAARDGVRRGMRPEDIIREIASEHHVRLNIGELRLLLAARRIPAEAAGEGSRGESRT